MATIELQHVSKTYSNNIEVVKDLSFTAKEGEFIVLVGPSGCGKSTILRMIAGLETVTQGDILFNDKLVNSQTPAERNIGMVFQEYALYPHLSVFDNIAFPLRTQRIKSNISKSDINKRVIEIAENIELKELLHRKPKELSGGQRQRVALGRAIIRNPQFFLFDEPLSNLDAKLRISMRQEIITLQRKYGITSIYVTHDQTEAMTMGNKIAILNNGSLQQFDTPYMIYHNPKNIFVADFIGIPNINFFNGTIIENSFTEKNSTLTLSHSYFTTLNIKGTCTLAIRPENLKIGKIYADNIININGIVEDNEYLGNETIIYCKIGNNQIRIRINQTFNIKINEPIDIYFDVNDILIFNENGDKI